MVIDEAAYEAYRKNKPGRAAKLKTVQQSEAFPSPSSPMAGALSDRVLETFRDGMIAAKDNPKAQTLLKANRVTGFEAVPTDYEKSLTEIAKAYPAPVAKVKKPIGLIRQIGRMGLICPIRPICRISPMKSLRNTDLLYSMTWVSDASPATIQRPEPFR